MNNDIKFSLVLLAGLCFIGMYFLTLRREKQLLNAEELEAKVTDIFILDVENPKFGFAIDRGEAFGNYITLEYSYDNQTKQFESPLINNTYHINDTVKIRRLNDSNIILCDEINKEQKSGDTLKITFIGMAALLISISLLGFSIS